MYFLLIAFCILSIARGQYQGAWIIAPYNFSSSPFCLPYAFQIDQYLENITYYYTNQSLGCTNQSTISYGLRSGSSCIFDSIGNLISPAAQGLLAWGIMENLAYYLMATIPIEEVTNIFEPLSFYAGQCSNILSVGLGEQYQAYVDLSGLGDNPFQILTMSYQVGECTSPGFPLPSWIDFSAGDAPSLKIYPGSEVQLGTYTLIMYYSTMVDAEDCNSFNISSGTSLCSEVWYDVQIQGLITTNEYTFLSPTWVNGSRVWLDPLLPYVDFDSVSDFLSQYYQSVSITFTVTSSLVLSIPQALNFNSSSSSLGIYTLSTNPVNVILTLESAGNFQPKFATSGYSFDADFSLNNSQVSFLLPSAAINDTVSQLVVFLNGSNSCNGYIYVADGLNPVINSSVIDLSNFLKISLPPVVNYPFFFKQLANVLPKTGTQFFIEFDRSTFNESTNQGLTLDLQMQDGNPLPDWLEFKEYTISGTPPDQLTGRELGMTLIVSNQYQSSEIEFTLEISISAIYALGLIGKYGAALLSAIGLLIYAIYFYNIFGKRFYRYSKDFVVRMGQEVNSRTIYPLTFASEAFTESKLIVHHLDRKIKKDIENSSKAQIAAYFCKPGSCQINRIKLVQAIEDTADNIRKGKDGNKLKKYTTIITSQKELITQLIINDFTIRLLDLAQEKSTKAAFILFKKHLFRLVDMDQRLQDGVCTFAVNKARLNSELRTHHINTFIPSAGDKLEKADISSSIRDSDGSLILESFRALKENKKGIEKQLVGSESIPHSRPNSMANIDLLISVLEAYAFNYHLIDANIHKIDIMARERSNNVWPFETIRRFLKLDLNLIGLSRKAIIGYGIKYTVQEDYVFFHGTASQDIKDKTLVVQIVNLRGRILRELWIKGVDSEPETGSLSEGVL